MWTSLGYIGLLVVLGYLIKILAQAIRTSGVEEFKVQVRFKGNGKPPDQLNK